MAALEGEFMDALSRKDNEAMIAITKKKGFSFRFEFRYRAAPLNFLVALGDPFIEQFQLCLDLGFNPNGDYREEPTTPIDLAIRLNRYRHFLMLYNHPKFEVSKQDEAVRNIATTFLEHDRLEMTRVLLQHPKLEPGLWAFGIDQGTHLGRFDFVQTVLFSYPGFYKVIPSRLRTLTRRPPVLKCLDLGDLFRQDKMKGKNQVHSNLCSIFAYSATLYYITVFLCDGYLKLIETDPKLFRFFKILTKLPLVFQERICAIYGANSNSTGPQSNNFSISKSDKDKVFSHLIFSLSNNLTYF